MRSPTISPMLSLPHLRHTTHSLHTAHITCRILKHHICMYFSFSCPMSRDTLRDVINLRLYVELFMFSYLKCSFLEMHQPQQENLCDQSSETSLSQNMEQRENSSITDSICFHVHLANEICTPETHKRKEQIMKAYYLRVEREKGVDTFWYTKKGRVHPKKNPRFEELNFIGKIPSKVNFSPAATEDLLTESESSMDSESEEENLEAPPSLENRPRAKTPEWLVSPERGFKCMACCRVFPSVQVLMEHVEHGVKEGFSCRLFHLSYSWLKAMYS